LRHSGFSAFPKIFGRLGGLAWSGAALMVLFSFALLLWLNAGRELNQENEIAQTFNINATESNPAQIESGEQISPLKNSKMTKSHRLTQTFLQFQNRRSRMRDKTTRIHYCGTIPAEIPRG
jgi:hypothetical protein